MEGSEIRGPDLHDVRIVTPAGAFLFIVDDSGEWKLFALDDDNRFTIAMYGEETPWTVAIPRFNAAAAAIERYAKDGDTVALQHLAGD